MKNLLIVGFFCFVLASGSGCLLTSVDDPGTTITCLNGGSLNDDGITCTCVDGFTGDTCDTAPESQSEPEPTPEPEPATVVTCLNGGSLNDDGITCACVDGYTGDTCDTEPEPEPVYITCLNGGSVNEGGTSCTCIDGYSGNTCDVEPPACFRPSITFTLNNFEAGPIDVGSWMFDDDATPFVENDDETSKYAYDGLQWNSDGHGDGSCDGLTPGSGEITTSLATAETMNAITDVGEVSLFIDDLTLDTFNHINVFDPSENWDTPGEAGDYRIYGGGNAYITYNDERVLTVSEISIEVVVYYPDPLGPGGEAGSAIGIGTGTIDLDNSDPDWLNEFNVDESNQVEFFFGSMSPVIQNCYGTYNITNLVVRPITTDPTCDDLSIDSDSDDLIDIFDAQ